MEELEKRVQVLDSKVKDLQGENRTLRHHMSLCKAQHSPSINFEPGHILPHLSREEGEDSEPEDDKSKIRLELPLMKRIKVEPEEDEDESS